MWAKKSTRAIESGAIAAVFFLIAVAISITIDRFSFVSVLVGIGLSFFSGYFFKRTIKLWKEYKTYGDF